MGILLGIKLFVVGIIMVTGGSAVRSPAKAKRLLESKKTEVTHTGKPWLGPDAGYSFELPPSAQARARRVPNGKHRVRKAT